MTNQDLGTVSAISLTTLSLSNTLNLGAEARPSEIQVISSLDLAVITEPSAGPEGKVWIVNLALGTPFFLSVKKDRTA